MSRKAALYDAIEHAHPGRMPVGHGSAAWRSKGLVPLPRARLARRHGFRAHHRFPAESSRP
ncbi:hypothetical protein GTY20_35330 [Streptomyces sp. SID4946]|nr:MULTISPECIES: hypothetical protein [unclassified Streptomyces]MYQ96157.1 hypothetical protein [Streptomyces sp. SID4946]